MFEGFTEETVDFLWGIRFNNQRDWFLAHKDQYQEALLQPVKDLAAEVYEEIKTSCPDQSFIFKVSRIYRDARRLHGRGPYKDHLWWCLRSGESEDWTEKPTFWFEIAPDYYSYGLGFWAPKAVVMETFRKEIDRNPENFEKLVRNFNRQDCFVLAGEEYKKSKPSPSEILKPWYQKKNIALSHESPLDEKIYSKTLKDEIVSGFLSLMPFYDFFNHVCAEISQPVSKKEEKM